MHRSTKRRLTPILYEDGLLGALLLTTTTWTSAFAQDDQTEAPADEVEEASLPPWSPLTMLPASTPSGANSPASSGATHGTASTAERAREPSELHVTGSHLGRPDLNTPAPVPALDRRQIDRAGRGSILGSQGNGINLHFDDNRGSGAIRPNLRSLGPERTLVLINGRRLVGGGTGADASVDLNVIPLSMIERVELLRDGASAVYGSDAIGGVLNIITRSDFSGVETSVYAGAGQHGGTALSVSATAGEVTEKAGILVSFEYFDESDLAAGDREFSAASRGLDFQTFEEKSGGSSWGPQTVIVDRTGARGNSAWQELIDSMPEGAKPILCRDSEKGWRPLEESDLYDAQPMVYLVPPQERYKLFAAGHYHVLPKVRGYFEGSYTNLNSVQRLAPEPLGGFNARARFLVSADNVYNEFERDFTDVHRRLVEASNRSRTQNSGTYRAVLGLDGGLPKGLGILSDWSWDGHFLYGRTDANDIAQGLLVASRLRNAVGPSFRDAAGVARCGTGPEDVIAGCVPLNLFEGKGSITPEMIDYISFDGRARGFSEQKIWSISASGPMITLFGRAVRLAVGYEHRREDGGFLPDSTTGSLDTMMETKGPTRGSYSADAAHAELAIPIRLGIPGIEILELSAAAHWSEFSSFGSELSWKVGGRWQVVEHVALRGTASTSFRAPSVSDLFEGEGQSFARVSDPCDTGRGPLDPEAAEACAAHGVPADHVDNRDRLPTTIGGNRDLHPETAIVVTGGIVITPKLGRWTEGLSLTVDYWMISLEDSIQPLTADVILSNCYRRPVEERANCDLVKRSADKKIVTIIDTQTNAGGIDTAGIDFEVGYRIPTGFGRVSVKLGATWLQKFDVIRPDESVVEVVGTYDARGTGGFSNGVLTELLFNGTFSFDFENFSFGANLNYVGPVRECENNACLVGRLEPGQTPPLSRNVDSFLSTDVFASYRIPSLLGVTRVDLGMNNATDAEPPVFYNGIMANSDPAGYDFLGRYLYCRLSQLF